MTEFAGIHTEKLQDKRDFQKLMLEVLNPLKSHYSKGGAQLYLGDTFAHYDINATYMEAVSRPLWALTPFWAGGGVEAIDAAKTCGVGTADAAKTVGVEAIDAAKTCGEETADAATAGGEAAESFLEIYRKALVNGTDPESPEYWGECGPFDQRFVEMAAISFNLMYAPESIWEHLTQNQKQNLANYLYKINEHPLPVCNWILFAVMVNVALKERGMRYCPELMNQYLEGLETFYLGDGWYCDGDSGQKDYYISFAIHYYSLIYADRMQKEDPERCTLYKQRAMEFAKQFIYWFDEDGDAIPFGRSLTYRFAQVSFFSVCLLTGLEPFPVEVMKGLIVRHFKQWFGRRIFDRDGILTIGYGYPNLTAAERYNAPGSPYWGMKAFAFLALPKEHPFWSVDAAPLPTEMKEQPMCSAPYADMLLYHYGSHTTAFTPGVYSPNGHGNIVEKYGKFAYDSKFGISVAHSQYVLEECAPDNMLAFLIGGYIYVRRICISSKILADRVISVWSPYPGIQVETTVIPNAGGHVRMHKITSEIECEAYEYGFSVRRDDFEKVDFEKDADKTSAWAKNRTMYCKVDGKVLEGDASLEEGTVLWANPNTNLLYQKTAIPGIKYHIGKGEQVFMTTIEAKG